jgi:hypothetical protein
MDIFKGVYELQKKINESGSAPSEGETPSTSYVLDKTHFKNSYDYIKRICNQINGSYEHGWNDACAVMIRKLVETLIIELYEANEINDKIKNIDGDYLFFNDLISKVTTESKWHLSRNTKRDLKKIKESGDKSAHNRKYIAIKTDIDDLKTPLRDIFQEFWEEIKKQRKKL